MWHTDTVKKFLKRKDMREQEVDEIIARAKSAAGGNEGLFPAGQLREVLGRDDLVKIFEDEWNRNPGFDGVLVFDEKDLP